MELANKECRYAKGFHDLLNVNDQMTAITFMSRPSSHYTPSSLAFASTCVFRRGFSVSSFILEKFGGEHLWSSGSIGLALGFLCTFFSSYALAVDLWILL